MKDEKMLMIGQTLLGFQSALKQSGSSLKEYLEKYYFLKWREDVLYATSLIRTTFVNAMNQFLVNEGLLNLERTQICIVTDPLAHDVEHIPTIHYKGMPYVTTHSMIYAKFLACHNPKIKGIFIDSPNLRLEVESPDRIQRGKYLVDFSQMDIEIRRNRGIDLNTYLFEKNKVKSILKEDMERSMDFFERLIIYSMSEIVQKNEKELKTLGIAIEIPSQPFPRFECDESHKKYGRGYEMKLGSMIKEQFFWITGILRENYDLVYPYLSPGGKVPLNQITSDMIYNYDIFAKSIIRSTGEQTPAIEILSGAIREWIYESIVERLLDNGIIHSRPVFNDGNVENIEELGSYGPFLMVANMVNDEGQPTFPDTFGGGIGIERTLYAICKGPLVEKIDDITFFGKNPDSHQIFLF